MTEVLNEMTKAEVAQKVREKLVGRRPVGVTLEVIEERIARVNDWWRVPVRPSAWPEPMFAYYEALAEVEGELVDEDHLNILLSTGEPLSEQAEPEAVAAA